MKNKKVIRSMLLAQIVLVVPLIGMLVSNEWDWGLADFVIVSVLLAGVGLAYEMIAGSHKNKKMMSAGIILAAILLAIYVELAVGIFD